MPPRGLRCGISGTEKGQRHDADGPPPLSASPMTPVERQRIYRAGHLEEERKRKAAHRDTHREQQRVWRAAHLEEVRERDRRYRLKRREEIAQKDAWYRAAHREEARNRTAAWRKANPEKTRENMRAWKESNPERVRADHSKDKAVRRGAALCDHAGCLTVGATQLAWMVNEHACYLCGTPVWQGVNLHMDHLLPVARGGIHCADNLRPACGPCNMRKGTKVVAL
jgi:hypothetical protein